MAEEESDGEDDYSKPCKPGKHNNVLPIWGNEQSMNLNPLILANIQGSTYFKVHLFKLKTYHEVVDEIYYQVKHLEPWERGSRKTAGQTGMCGGVRGVGAGGIVSTAYCLLYKLYTLRLTRKQLNGLLNHTDSPFIRALGFMYIRYTQPPADLFEWYQDYFDDDEPVDPRAGGGQPTTIGAMCRHLLTKLDWFSTLFPRIPVPIQKQIEQRLVEYDRENNANNWEQQGQQGTAAAAATRYDANPPPDKYPRDSGDRNARANRDRDNARNDRVERDSYRSDRAGERDNYRNDRTDRDNHRNDRTDRDNLRNDRDRDRDRRDRDRDRNRDRDRDRERERDRDRDRERDRDRHRNRDRSPRDRRHR